MTSTFSLVRVVRIFVCAAVVLVIPLSAFAQQPSAQEVREELDKLRKEFEAVRDSYGARLSALEQKLAAMGGQPAQAPPAQQPTQPPVQAPVPPGAAGATEVQVPQGAAGAGGPTGALPVYGSTSALSKIFNPDIAVIGNFVGAAGKNDVNPSG